MKQKLGSRFNPGYRPAKLTEQRIAVSKTFVPEGNKKNKIHTACNPLLKGVVSIQN